MTKKGRSFSSLRREEYLELMANETYDLIVIGGGATGAGIALDAASRGLKTALVEKGDFASGTSSKSTKLIHGGLRYLKQLEVGLVRESGTERAVVNRLVPHLCLPEKMLLPLIEGGTFGKLSTSLGLWVYDFVAGVESSDRRRMLSKEATLELEPLLDEKVLKGSGYYAEYRTDDARLTIELIKKAVSFGAIAVNYCKAVDFIYDEDQIVGVKCQDELGNKEIIVKSQKVVSAGGPWVDKLRRINDSINDKRLRPTKGVHIVVPRDRLPLQQSVYFDVPDGRMIFAIPRGRVTYIGTTDTVYTGSLDRVVATQADLEYLLKAVNNMFPSVNIGRYDVISNWAGLRPLIHEKGKSPSEVSRKDEIFEAKDGLLSIAGGKLTGYRKMAERIVDRVVECCHFENRSVAHSSKTKEIPLTNEPLGGNSAVLELIEELSKKAVKLGLDAYYGWYLVTNYGTAGRGILKKTKKIKIADLEVALAIAELNYCLEEEMIQCVDDFLIRRTGRLYFDIFSIEKIKVEVLNRMNKHLNWSKERREEEEQRLKQLIQDATTYYDSEIVEEGVLSTIA